MFSRIQQIFSKKSSKKAVPTPLVMGQRTSKSKPLTVTATSPTTLVEPPQVSLDSLRLVECLEETSSHRRWRVVHNKTGKRYDLKVTHTSKLSPEERIRARHETDALRIVKDDPSFIHMAAQWDDRSRSYQVSEFMPLTLEAARTQQTFDAGRVRLYAAHLVHCLDVLHTGGITHNHVKVSNIFLTSTGRPVLGGMDRVNILQSTLACPDDFEDFGASNYAEGGYFHFDLAYDREEFAGDIYALAKAMYKMTTGRRLRRNARGPIFQPGDGVPQPLRDLIASIVSPRPSSLQTDMARIKAHPYFSGIDWLKIACPDAEMFNPVTINTKPEHPDATVHRKELPDTRCDPRDIAFSKIDRKPLSNLPPNIPTQTIRRYIPGAYFMPHYSVNQQSERLSEEGRGGGGGCSQRAVWDYPVVDGRPGRRGEGDGVSPASITGYP